MPQIILIMFVFVICKIVMKKNIQDVTKHWISCNMAKVNLTLPITQHYCQFRVIDSITFWWFLIEINLPVNVQFKSIKGKKSMISSLIHHVFFTKRMFVFVLVKFHRQCRFKFQIMLTFRLSTILKLVSLDTSYFICYASRIVQIDDPYWFHKVNFISMYTAHYKCLCTLFCMSKGGRHICFTIKNIL